MDNGNGDTKTMPLRSKPSFIKVLIGDFASELRMPPAFGKNFKGLIPRTVKIVSPAARNSWQVKLEKDENGFFFKEGWREFVEENSLQLGDFLVFKFDRKWKFYVRMYGLSACEKEVAPSARRKHGKLPSCGEAIRKSSPAEIKSERVPLVPELYEGPPLGGTDRDKSASPRQDQHEEEGMAVVCVEKDGAIHPHFEIVINQMHLQNRHLNVPVSFVKNHLGACPQTVWLHVAERMWPVRLSTYTTYARFSLGWAAFVKESNLRAGDTCVFELINGGSDGDVRLKVSIYNELE